MSDSIEILRKLIPHIEKAAGTPEVKANVTRALTEAIEALEEKESRTSKPSTEGDELGLTLDTATDHLLKLSSGELGRTTAKAERNAAAVDQLAALVRNEG